MVSLLRAPVGTLPAGPVLAHPASASSASTPATTLSQRSLTDMGTIFIKGCREVKLKVDGIIGPKSSSRAALRFDRVCTRFNLHSDRRPARFAHEAQTASSRSRRSEPPVIVDNVQLHSDGRLDRFASFVARKMRQPFHEAQPRAPAVGEASR